MHFFKQTQMKMRFFKLIHYILLGFLYTLLNFYYQEKERNPFSIISDYLIVKILIILCIRNEIIFLCMGENICFLGEKEILLTYLYVTIFHEVIMKHITCINFSMFNRSLSYLLDFKYFLNTSNTGTNIQCSFALN